jgi:hypothetical protein
LLARGRAGRRARHHTGKEIIVIEKTLRNLQDLKYQTVRVGALTNRRRTSSDVIAAAVAMGHRIKVLAGVEWIQIQGGAK